VDRPLNRFLPYVALVAMTATWTWWTLDSGAYFGVVFYPGAILMLGVLLVMLRVANWHGRLSGAPLIAVVALGVLALYTFVSIVWSPAREAALSDSHRVILYAVAFGIGVWTCHLLGRRMALALLPLAAAAGIAGLVTLFRLLTADAAFPLLEFGVLELPLGYHNANAAFFVCALFAALGLAADDERDWRLRGTMAGIATMCAGLALLSQSRGSVLAALVGFAAFVAISQSRLRALVYLAIGLVPAALVAPVLLDVYSTAAGDGDVLDAMRLAAAALGVVAVLAALVGGAVAVSERRLEPSPGSVRIARRVVAGLAVLAGLVGGVLFVSSQGNPVDWVNQRFSEFEQGGTPDLERSRFAFNAGSERYDYWRVALDEFAQDPVRGAGAGAFQYSYLRDGDSTETPRDAHSVEIELLSELGIPGLALFAIFVVAVVVAGLRSRRLGPAAAALCAGAFAAAGYWLAHASIEWFWTYPGVTAPVMALLGSACAPAVLWPGHRSPRLGRGLLAFGAVVVALTMLPPFLSERYTDQAYRGWRSDPQGAYSALDRAATLNPFSDAPLLAEGAIARKLGEIERALAAFEEALERKPDEWVAHYYHGLLLARDDPDAARRELELAAELSPRSPDPQRALSELDRQEVSAPPGF